MQCKYFNGLQKLRHTCINVVNKYIYMYILSSLLFLHYTFNSETCSPLVVLHTLIQQSGVCAVTR